MADKKQDKSVNEPVDKLLDIKRRLEELSAEAEAEKSKILASRTPAVILFVDLVGSTKFKSEHPDNPEIWLLRLKQFVEVVKEQVTSTKGTVVKIIGDEVMALYQGPAAIQSAAQFLIATPELGKSLTELTGYRTELKIAIDYGDVYLVDYSEHSSHDPQGLPVDRCARISKLCYPDTVLSSFDFSSKAKGLQWNNIGSANLAGIGETMIFQFNANTVILEETVQISKVALDQMKADVKAANLTTQALTVENNNLTEKNKGLAVALETKGIDVDKSLIAEQPEETNEGDEESPWEGVEKLITQLKSLIQTSPADSGEYARFLFLYKRGEPEEYDKFKDRTFDSCIESNLVMEDANERWVLDTSHRRNQAAIRTMNQLDSLLADIEVRAEDLFDYDLTSPEFWKKYIGYSVT